MCRYVNDWSYVNIGFFNIKLLIEKLLVYITYFLIYVKTKIPDTFETTVLYKILSKITHEIFIILLETYCL
jgi:hypothetical protein